MALASQRGGFSALSGFSLLALAILLAGFANRTSARCVRRGCVYSTSSADPTRPDPTRSGSALRPGSGARAPQTKGSTRRVKARSSRPRFRRATPSCPATHIRASIAARGSRSRSRDPHPLPQLAKALALRGRSTRQSHSLQRRSQPDFSVPAQGRSALSRSCRGSGRWDRDAARLGMGQGVLAPESRPLYGFGHRTPDGRDAVSPGRQSRPFQANPGLCDLPLRGVRRHSDCPVSTQATSGTPGLRPGDLH